MDQPKTQAQQTPLDPMKKPKSMLLHWLVFVVVVVGIVGGAWYFRTDIGLDKLIKNINSSLSTNSANTNRPFTGGGSMASISSMLAAQNDIKKFSNYDELKSFLEEHQTGGDIYSQYSSSIRRGEIGLDAMSKVPSTAFGLGTADLRSSDSSYSTTNVQVAGVDEADIIKTDGTYVYAVSKNNVFIIKARPAGESSILATIKLTSTPQDIYLNGDSLVIYGTDSTINKKPALESYHPNSAYAFLKVFDIKDKSNPKQVRDLDFEGSVVNTRMIGDYVYFVTTQSTYNILDEYPIPIVLDEGTVLPTKCSAGLKCNNPDVWYIDMPYNAYTFTSVNAINVVNNTKAINSNVYLLNSGENMYVSKDNIYIAYTKYVSENLLRLEAMRDYLYPKLSDKEKSRINEIESVSSNILTNDEKLQKIGEILSRYIAQQTHTQQDALQMDLDAAMKKKYQDLSKELEKTVIHKIAIDNDKLTYKESGEVTGKVLNQFSMDEADGYFRIATTKNRTWSQFIDGNNDSYSNVYVLDAKLKVVGKVENIAKGEQIYSVRFMQKRVYLVTFQKIDPLFAIDLKDPKNPKILGELKVPGFSSYLHPYDDNTLIGFGKDADANGRTKGLKLSLFDVSDVANLKEVDTYTMGEQGSDSIALNDHKAFLFDKDKQLLAIPVTLRESIGTKLGNISTNGAMVFKITKEAITFREILKHSDGSQDDNTLNNYYGYDYYGTMVKRSLYIGDVLYTLSDKYLKMNELSDLASVKSVTLTPGSDEGDFQIIR